MMRCVRANLLGKPREVRGVLRIDSQPARGGWSELERQAIERDLPGRKRSLVTFPAFPRLEAEVRGLPFARRAPRIQRGRCRPINQQRSEPFEAPALPGVDHGRLA